MKSAAAYALVFAAAVSAQSFDAAEVLLPFHDHESKVMALAKAVPEEKYSWRPGPGVRSFAEVFRHIAYGNTLMLSIADAPSKEALSKRIEENARKEHAPVNKERILQELNDSFATTRKAMETARTPSLGGEVLFFGQKTTLRGLFIWIDGHVAEHLGQAIAYARMNEIVPPWSPGKEPPEDPVAVIRKSAEDWNRGDIAAFVSSYERSPETTFVGTGVSHGTENILARYRRAYPDTAHMGKLTFSELQPRMLTPALAIVTGRFALERDPASGGRSTGIFTLVLRRGPDGWRIIHDHTSSLPQ